MKTAFYGQGVTLIEWSELIREILPEHVTEVTIEKDMEKGFGLQTNPCGGERMRVLGIESSSLVASVALVTDDILTGEYTANFKKDPFSDSASHAG